MKKYLFFICVIMSCKKEKHVPEALLGKWESQYIYVENYINNFTDTIIRIDTIKNNQLTWIQFNRDFSVITNGLNPSCVGTYNLIRNNNFLEMYYPCLQIEGISTGVYLSKIRLLNTEYLILEGSFETGFSYITYSKIN